jgi:hypothetical protein
MQMAWFRVPSVGLFFMLVCGSIAVNAQNGPEPADTRVDRCIRWLKAIQPDQNILSATDVCRGVQTSNAGGHYSLKCNSTATIRGTQWPSRCNFAGLVTPGDTLAVDFRTGSSGGWEFLAAWPADAQHAAASGADSQYAAATLYSRTDFAIGKDRLPAGLYKLFPRKDDEGWILDLAREDGEWDEPLSAGHPSWHARMNLIDGADPSKKQKPVADILAVPKRCPAASPVGTVRELEFSFGNRDVSVCLSLNQEPPSAPEEISKR